jgi:hypothetical protein
MQTCNASGLLGTYRMIPCRARPSIVARGGLSRGMSGALLKSLNTT